MRWLQQERHKQLGASTDNNFAAPATTNFTVRHNYARAKQPTAHIAFRLKSVRSRSIPRLMMIRWIFWRMSPSLVRLRGPPRLRVQRKIWSFRTPFGQEFEHKNKVYYHDLYCSRHIFLNTFPLKSCSKIFTQNCNTLFFEHFSASVNFCCSVQKNTEPFFWTACLRLSASGE